MILTVNWKRRARQNRPARQVKTMMEKILVIGSNSFSGASFVSRALEGGAEVVGVSRSRQPSPVFLPYRWLPAKTQKGFKFHPIDINRDLPALSRILRKFKPSYVVNFASQSMVAESWQNPVHWMMTNVVSTVRLHELLRGCDFLKKYIHISTPEVYGSCTGLIPEETRYNPSTPYGVSRAAADMSLTTYFKHYGFPVVFTRAANVYGPGQQLYRIIPRAIFFFLTGKKLKLHGGGRSVRSFIHIRDVSEGTWKAMLQASPGEIFHFSTDQNLAVREVVEKIAQKTGVRFDACVESVGERPGKDAAYLLDNAKARKLLNWNPKISLDEGLDETISWVKNNLKTLGRQSPDYIHKP